MLLSIAFMRSIVGLALLVQLLCLKSAAASSSIRIDALEVREDSSILVIKGAFTQQPPTVWVNGMEMKVSRYNDSVIECPIPSSGKGSCGPVLVACGNEISNFRKLTGWHLDMNYSFVHGYSDGGDDRYGNEWKLFFRVDAEAILRSPDHRTRYLLSTSGSSYLYYQGGEKGIRGGGGNFSDSSYRTNNFQASAEFDLFNREIHFMAVVHLDSNFNIISGTTGPCSSPGYTNCYEWKAYDFVEFPPSREWLASIGREEEPASLHTATTSYTIHPNPAKGRLVISWQGPSYNATPITAISLYTLEGRLVRPFNPSQMVRSGNECVLSLSQIPKGSYVLQVYSADRASSHLLQIAE